MQIDEKARAAAVEVAKEMVADRANHWEIADAVIDAYLRALAPPQMVKLSPEDERLLEKALSASRTAVYEIVPASLSPGSTGETEGWQPIETAPKDGTVIILGALEQQYNGQPVAPRSTVGHWTTEEECREQIGDCGGECRCPEYVYHDPYWMSWDGGFTTENPPTHWRPLPAPPSAMLSAAGERCAKAAEGQDGDGLHCRSLLEGQHAEYYDCGQIDASHSIAAAIRAQGE